MNCVYVNIARENEWKQPIDTRNQIKDATRQTFNGKKWFSLISGFDDGQPVMPHNRTIRKMHLVSIWCTPLLDALAFRSRKSSSARFGHEQSASNLCTNQAVSNFHTKWNQSTLELVYFTQMESVTHIAHTFLKKAELTKHKENNLRRIKAKNGTKNWNWKAIVYNFLCQWY